MGEIILLVQVNEKTNLLPAMQKLLVLDQSFELPVFEKMDEKTIVTNLKTCLNFSQKGHPRLEYTVNIIPCV